MRITIEPTSTQDTLDRIVAVTQDMMCVHHKVVIEHPYDDLNMEHVASLVRSALVAYGFNRESVNQHLSGDE